MTVIEVKPHGNGWKVFEAPGVEPVFLQKDQAINYAQNRVSFRSGEVRIFHLFFRLDLQARKLRYLSRSPGKANCGRKRSFSRRAPWPRNEMS